MPTSRGMRRLIAPVVIALLIGVGGCSSEPATRVLFVGNSYTFYNDMPDMFEDLAEASGLDVEIGMEAPGGWWLRDHADSEQTLDNIGTGDWDFVVLQEQSQLTAVRDLANIETWPAAKTLANATWRAGGDVILFMTWAHELGSSEIGHANYESMQTAVGGTYEALAESLDAAIAPVGAAWWLARESGQAVLYQADGSHPTKEGSYLAAAVLASAVLGVPLEEIDEKLGLDDDTAKRLREYAHQAVSGTRPWSG